MKTLIKDNYRVTSMKKILALQKDRFSATLIKGSTISKVIIHEAYFREYY